MGKMEKVGRSLIRGASRDQVNRLGQKLEGSTGGLKSDASSRIESLAAEIRRLGEGLERPDEVSRVARELERTADYIRYRRSVDIAGDTLDYVRRSPVFWGLGGLLGSYLVYRAVRRSRD